MGSRTPHTTVEQLFFLPYPWIRSQEHIYKGWVFFPSRYSHGFVSRFLTTDMWWQTHTCMPIIVFFLFCLWEAVTGRHVLLLLLFFESLLPWPLNLYVFVNGVYGYKHIRGIQLRFLFPVFGKLSSEDIISNDGLFYSILLYAFCDFVLDQEVCGYKHIRRTRLCFFPLSLECCLPKT